MHIVSAAIISVITVRINLLATALSQWLSACLAVCVCMPDVCPPDVICALDAIAVHSHSAWTPQQQRLLPHTTMMLHPRGSEQVDSVQFRLFWLLIVSALSDVGIIAPKNAWSHRSCSHNHFVAAMNENNKREKHIDWGQNRFCFSSRVCVFACKCWVIMGDKIFNRVHQLQSTEHSCLHISHKHTMTHLTAPLHLRSD